MNSQSRIKGLQADPVYLYVSNSHTKKMGLQYPQSPIRLQVFTLQARHTTCQVVLNLTVSHPKITSTKSTFGIDREETDFVVVVGVFPQLSKPYLTGHVPVKRYYKSAGYSDKDIISQPYTSP